MQDPGNTQKYIRYGYVQNNPWKYTDPSGWTAEEDKLKAQRADEEVRKRGQSMLDWNAQQSAVDANGLSSFFGRLFRTIGRALGITTPDLPGMEIALDEIVIQGKKRSSTSGYSGDGQSGGSENWATATLAFIGTDIAILEPTDAAWPKWAGYAVAGGAAATYLYSGDYVAKMQREIDGISQRVAGPQGFQYALTATRSGDYPNVRGGTTNLNAGEVWKYGETTSPNRYSQNYLDSMGLTMQQQFFGNQMQIKIQEKFMIYGYFFTNGTLPPGNSIFR